LEAVALQLFTSYGWFFVVRFNLKFGWLSVLPNVCNNWFDSLHFKGMKPNFIYYLKKIVLRKKDLFILWTGHASSLGKLACRQSAKLLAFK